MAELYRNAAVAPGIAVRTLNRGAGALMKTFRGWSGMLRALREAGPAVCDGRHRSERRALACAGVLV